MAAGKQLRFASANVPAEKQVCVLSSHMVCGCCCVRLLLQVCVPKNTVVVVTREKGGFLSVLQSSLSTGAEPDPRLAEVRWGRKGARQLLGLTMQCAVCLCEQSLDSTTGPGSCHHQCCALLCHMVLLQVSTCLASIAQGVHTKSRAWVARPHASQVKVAVAAVSSIAPHLHLHLLLCTLQVAVSFHSVSDSSTPGWRNTHTHAGCLLCSQGGWVSAGGGVSSSPGPLDGLMSPRGTNSFVDGLLGTAKGSGTALGRRWTARTFLAGTCADAAASRVLSSSCGGP